MSEPREPDAIPEPSLGGTPEAMTDEEFDRHVMASMFGTPASGVPRVRAYVAGLRAEVKRLTAERDRMSRLYDLELSRAVVAEGDGFEKMLRARAAEARVAKLTEALRRPSVDLIDDLYQFAIDTYGIDTRNFIVDLLDEFARALGCIPEENQR